MGKQLQAEPVRMTLDELFKKFFSSLIDLIEKIQVTEVDVPIPGRNSSDSNNWKILKGEDTSAEG